MTRSHIRIVILAMALVVGITTASAQGTAKSAAAPTGNRLRDLPAPDFQLTTLAGEPVSPERYAGWILVLHFFAGEGAETERLLKEMSFFHSRGRELEIAYLGVSTAPRERLQALAGLYGVEYDLAVDKDGEVTRRFLGGRTTGMFLIDHRGTARFIREDFPTAMRDITRGVLSRLLNELRESLRTRPRLEIPWRLLPAMPAFSGTDLDGHRHTSQEYLGKPLLVYFLERECVHCKTLAPFLSEVYFRYRNRIRFLGIATEDPEGDLKQQLAIMGLPFPVILDPERSIRRSFNSLRGNPNLVWVDAKGQMRWRELGVPEDAASLLDLEARVLLGEADPAKLSTTEYVGSRTCRVCHEPEFRDWLKTPHANAMISLRNGNDWSRHECLSCHVTGLQQPGGYKDASSSRMAQVQCESCHGIGGGHGLPQGAARMNAMSQCLQCHKGKYELQQSLHQSVAWMSHRDTPDAATLYAYSPGHIDEADRALRNRLHALTFLRGTAYVGSDACAPCHAELFKKWKTSGHGKALRTLQAAGREDEQECLLCHTTAYGELSGYRGSNTPSLAGVGCESCHGPGADHVAAGKDATAASIYGLVSDCESCQTEPGCRTCHDRENDPDFRMPENVRQALHPAKP